MTSIDDTVSPQYQKILQAPIELTNLLNGTGFFKSVLRGYPEDYYKTLSGDIATIFFEGLKFPDKRTMSLRNRPDFQNSMIGLICKGTKTEVHDKISSNSIFVLNQFGNEITDGDPVWTTLNGTVRDTEVVDFQIIPERAGKSLLTTAIISLKHDVRFRR